MAYEPRTYRARVAAPDLVTFEVAVLETDLQISARCDLSVHARSLVAEARSQLEGFLAQHPRFGETFVPFEVPADAPPLIAAMAAAAEAGGVGPMAAVAGAIAEYVGRGLLADSDEVIVENGGDVFLAGSTDRTVAVHAGASPLTGKAGIVLPGAEMPVAVCTSSATVGHSTSLGSADAACVVADGGALADAVASMIGNRVHDEADIAPAIERALTVEGVRGAVVVLGEHLGAAGSIRLEAL